MIIKSMARKAPTFAQLIAYIGRDADPAPGTIFARNLYHCGADERVVSGQFLDNYRHLPKRKNGNALYHEVIVLEAQPHLNRDQLNAALTDLADVYCARRAPGQLAWGRIHHDTDHPHIHLMISANDVRSAKRVRLEKSSFSHIQREMEAYKEQAWPELAGTPTYSRPRDRESPSVTRVEGEAIRRTGKASRKISVRGAVWNALARSKNRPELTENLLERGFELYRRGKQTGVREIASGRKYRLSTLGLEAAFDRAVRQAHSKTDETSKPSQSRPAGGKQRSSPRKDPNNQGSFPRSGIPSDAPVQSQSDSDARTAALLRRRAELERQADEQLKGFDNEHYEDHER